MRLFPFPLPFRSLLIPNPSALLSQIHPRSRTVPPGFHLLRSRARSHPIGAPWPSICRGFCSPGRGGDMAVVAAMAAAEEGSPAKRFWIRTKKETVYALYSPFVVCLAAGKLDHEVFRQYISQDVFFLRAFANAYEVAEECADDDDSKAAIAELRKSVLRKLDALTSSNPLLDEWGVDFTKETAPNPATAKYTKLLQETAAGKVGGGKVPIKIVTPFEKTKIAAYTAGAMTPCLRLYAYLVKELQVFLEPDHSSHPYKKWLDGHSYASFENSALQIEELLDKLSVTLTGEELEVIEKLYKQAMKLEIEFFHTQPVIQQTVVPLIRLHDPSRQQLVVFTDFDLTCSIVDSSAILAEIAILTASKADQNDTDRPNSQKTSAELRNSWHDLSSQYTEEHEQCIEKVLMAKKAEGFDYEGLSKALEHLDEFEKRANARVIESGVLKGLNLDDIRRAGERMNLQDGCLEFFQKIVKTDLNADFHVLSYCWCADLIRAAFSAGGLGALNIHANEFLCEGSISTGAIAKNVESPLDKIHAFRKILGSSSGSGKHFSVYIGDSVGDLLCLLEADVGIVVGSSVSLRRVGAHFGVSFVPLFPAVVKKQGELMEDGSPVWKGLSGVLYTVSSWQEIHAFVLGRLYISRYSSTDSGDYFYNKPLSTFGIQVHISMSLPGHFHISGISNYWARDTFGKVTLAAFGCEIYSFVVVSGCFSTGSAILISLETVLAFGCRDAKNFHCFESSELFLCWHS